jgi:hypothetical protein
MDMNHYSLELIARQQIAERHAGVALYELARAAAPPRRSLRVVVGLALIRLGTRALGPAHRTLSPRTS